MKRTAPFAAIALAALLMPAPAPAADVVNVANVSRTLFSLPFWVAQHRGFLKAEGLETTSSILDNAEKINAALRAGTMQIAMGTPEAVIIDAYNGGTLRLIAGNTGKLPHFIIARPHIKSLKDLRGANFGILSEKEGSTYVVQDIAKAIGLTPADYTMTAVGGAPTRWKLLQAGKIDVGLQPFPLSYIAEDAGFTNLGSVIPFVPDWQFTTINADMTWAAKNRDVVVRFLRAVQRGRDFMRTNPQETAEIAAKELQDDGRALRARDGRRREARHPRSQPGTDRARTAQGGCDAPARRRHRAGRSLRPRPLRRPELLAREPGEEVGRSQSASS